MLCKPDDLNLISIFHAGILNYIILPDNSSDEACDRGFFCPRLIFINSQVRQHLSRLPTIDPNTRTLLITGLHQPESSLFAFSDENIQLYILCENISLFYP